MSNAIQSNQYSKPQRLVRMIFSVGVAMLCAATTSQATIQAQNQTDSQDEDSKIVRTLFVPFESLEVLLDGNSNRVMLTNEEYEALVESAKTREILRAPADSAIVSAEFSGQVFEGISQITGKLTIETLNDGLVQIPLAISGVGIRDAQLDGKPANLWRNKSGEIVLLVSGRGKKNLILDLTVPMATTAARQSMSIQLPTAFASKFILTVPGNVEVKAGLSVADRQFDEGANETRFDLLTDRKPFTLEMSLNNRLLKDEQVVVARSVLFHKLAPDEHQLHVTSSLDVIHGAVEQVRFVIPDGYAVSDVVSELLSQWEIETESDRSVLSVQLREATREDIVLNIVASRSVDGESEWTAPDFQPLDVAGHVAVIGVLADINLQMEKIDSEGVIPIDHEFLTSAIPQSTLKSQFANPVSIVAAFYAPHSEYSIQSRFVAPDPRLIVNSNSRLVIEDGQLELQSGLSLLSAYGSQFSIELELPESWRFSEVTGIDGTLIPFDRLDSPGDTTTSSRIQIQLGKRIDADEPTRLFFKAQSTPANWLDDWTDYEIQFPNLKVAGSTVHVGALAVTIDSDVVLKPNATEGLQTLDEGTKARLQFLSDATPLVYQFQDSNFQLTMDLEKLSPSVNAKTYSFFTVTPTELIVQGELEFEVRQAKADEFKFQLPLDSPTSISLSGINNRLKDYYSQDEDDSRMWTVLLSKAQQGIVKIRFDYRQPLDATLQGELQVSPVEALDVQFQTSMAAVEGSPELDVEIETNGRSVDIGELSDAIYKPGRYMLGAYSWPSENGNITIKSARRPIYQLPSAIVQRAEMVTSISPAGQTQTAARFHLVTKQPFLRIQLPDESKLWSIVLNGKPAKPLVDGNDLLVSLYDSESTSLCDLQVVFESTIDSFGLVGNLTTQAPLISLHESADSAGQEVPLVDLKWRLIMPDGYEVTQTNSAFNFAHVNKRTTLFGRLGQWLKTIGGDIGGQQSFLQVDSYASETDGYYQPNLSMDPTMGLPRSGRSDLDELSPNELNSDDEMDMGGEGGAGAEDTEGRRSSKSEESKSFQIIEENSESEKKEPQPNAPTKAGKNEATKANAPERSWALRGLRSLDIKLTEKGNSVEFVSLGQESLLEATIANQSRINWFGVAIALVLGVIGILMTGQSSGRKVAFVMLIVLAASFLPLFGKTLAAFRPVADWMLLAAIGLTAYFVFAALLKRLCETTTRAIVKLPMLFFMLSACMFASGEIQAQEVVDNVDQLRAIFDKLQTKTPVKLPQDAIIIPFDADDPDGRENADRLLLPYEHYIELMAKAESGLDTDSERPPADYVLSSSRYSVDLTLEEDLVINGAMAIELFVDEAITVALPLFGGAIADAKVDGRPAKMQFAERSPAQSKSGRANNNRNSTNHVILLHLEGKGTKQFEFTVRVGLERQGGWRSLNVRMPIGITRGIDINVPTELSSENIEVRLTADSDRRSLEVEPGQVIKSVLTADGSFNLQWKPSTASQAIDQSLTAESEALFDVREDGLRLAWHVDLSFRGAERNAFSFTVPTGFLVEQVTGDNVRAWDVKSKDQGSELEIVLLSPVKGSESFLVELSKRDFAIDDDAKSFSVPTVKTIGAALDRGTLMIRRSPIIELKTTETNAASRVDIDPTKCRIDVSAVDSSSSPLGILTYQNLRFVTNPFKILLQAKLIPQSIKAETKTILRLGQSEADHETKIDLEVGPRPIYEISLDVPKQIEIASVDAGLDESWAIEMIGDVQRVHLFLPRGIAGKISIFMNGDFPEYAGGEAWSVPSITVNQADSQVGQIAIQVDPSLRVSIDSLKDCESILLQQLNSWMNPQQRTSSRLALKTTGPDYEATLKFSNIQPRINCESVTNVRLTFFAIEETILLDFDIQQAGTRQIQFLLPDTMKDSRIDAQLVSEMTRVPAPAPNAGMTLVTLDLQDEVIDAYRVVIENDRPLAESNQVVPMPIVLSGETTQRYVTLQNAGRDEIKVQPTTGFQVLNRQLNQYAMLSQKMGGGELTMAYLAKQDVENPQLRFDTNQRQSVETVQARIAFSKTVMVVDSGGAYRAVQTFQVSNRSEQYLDVELPEDSTLLTVWVEGSPVKPVQWDSEGQDRRLRIPLVKTPAGDLDYPVQLKYAGRLGDLTALQQVDFPVINTLNVNVQLSQLHLRLPESHQWMNFGGSMTKVDSQGELEQGFLSYKAQQIRELTEQIKLSKGKSGSFSNDRAYGNLKILEKEMNSYQQQGSADAINLRGGVNIKNALSLSDNQAAIVRAQREAVDVKDDSLLLQDNRANIYKALTDQKLRIARNEITRQGQNWKRAEKSALQTQNQSGDDSKQKGYAANEGGFDRQWLDRNKLETDGDGKDKTELNDVLDADGSAMFDQNQGKEQLQSQIQKSPVQQKPQSAGQGGRGAYQGMLEDEFRFANPQDTSINLVQGEKRSVDQINMPADEPGRGRGFGGENGQLDPSSSSEESRQRSPFVRGGISTSSLVRLQGGGSTASGWTGLASLDIELPERGVDYYFKSPRGNATVSARPIATSSINQWMTALIGLGICLFGWIIWKVFTRLGKSTVWQVIGFAMLLLVSMFSFGTGILPVFGTIGLGCAALIALNIIGQAIYSQTPEASV